MKTQNFFQYEDNDRSSGFSPHANNNRTTFSTSLNETIENLADKVLDEGKKRFGNLIEQCQGSLNFYTHSMIQNIDDGVLDLLIMGVLWDVYNGKWGNSPFKRNEKIFNKLVKLKLEYPQMISKLERLSSKLARKVLDNPGYSTVEDSLVNLKMLCMWLTATNEFNEEVRRFYPWINFFDSVPQSFVKIYLDELAGFAQWFKNEALKSLRNFSIEINPTVNRNGSDQIRPVKYKAGNDETEAYLNLVGTVMLNRKMKRDFFGTNHQILFLPRTMAALKKCQSVEILKGHICSNCTLNCKISNLSEEMKEKGIYTFIIQEDSSITTYLNKWANQKEVGIIGSANVNDLLSVALEMKRLNLPAQCIILENDVYKEQLFAETKKTVNRPFSKTHKKQAFAFA